MCSQPTLSRLENSPRLRDVIRLTYTLVDAWMDSYPCEPASAGCCRSVLDRRGVAPRSPNPSLKRVAMYGSSGGEKPKAILCASSEEMCGRINPTKNRTLTNRTG